MELRGVELLGVALLGVAVSRMGRLTDLGVMLKEGPLVELGVASRGIQGPFLAKADSSTVLFSMAPFLRKSDGGAFSLKRPS